MFRSTHAACSSPLQHATLIIVHDGRHCFQQTLVLVKLNMLNRMLPLSGGSNSQPSAVTAAAEQQRQIAGAVRCQGMTALRSVVVSSGHNSTSYDGAFSCLLCIRCALCGAPWLSATSNVRQEWPGLLAHIVAVFLGMLIKPSTRLHNTSYSCAGCAR